MRLGVNTLFLIPGEVGGSETYLVQTLLAMARQHPETDLVLFTNLENDALLRTTFRGFPQASFRLLPFRASNRYARILREQFQLPFLVRISGVNILWSPGYTAPILCPVPQAVSILDMQYRSHPEDLTFQARAATDILVRLAARRCRKVLTISGFSRREILRYTGAKPENICMTCLAADPAFAAEQNQQGIGQHLAPILPPDIPYLLCVANTYPHKNVAALVTAFGRIQDRIPHHLILVGKPRRGEPAVAQALAHVPGPARVHRLQRVDRDLLIALYQGAGLFVFPSLYEGFGLPVLEAMAAGVPVLTTRLGSIPEVGGDCVGYFDPDREGSLESGILDMLAMQEEKRRKWIIQARKRARTFSWSRTARETLICLTSR